MTFDIGAKPESPRLPLFCRVRAYFCLTSEFSWKRLFMQNDGPVVLDFNAEQVRHYGVELVFVYNILVGDPGRTLLEFYEHVFEQGLVHRTIDRFVNILFLGEKILFEAAKGWQIYAFLTGIYRDSS